MSDYTLRVPDALVEAIAGQLADQLAERMVPPSEPYISAEEAAEYIAAPRKRIYEIAGKGAIPVYGDGRRQLFRRSDLDAYLAASP